MQTKAARIAELEGLLEAVTAHRDDAVERLAGVQKAADAVEALRLAAEREAEAASRAAQEADRRTREAREGIVVLESALSAQEHLVAIAQERSDDYLKRIRDLEAALTEAPLEGAAMVLRRELEQTQAFLTASRVKSRARGHALAALQESHRRLKLASASKDRRISAMQGELERAGLRPVGATATSGALGRLAPGFFPLAMEEVTSIDLEDAQAEEIDRLRRVIEEIAQNRAKGVLRMAADRHADDTIDRLMRERVEVTEAIAELRGLYAVNANDAEHVLKACHEIRQSREQLAGFREALASSKASDADARSEVDRLQERIGRAHAAGWDENGDGSVPIPFPSELTIRMQGQHPTTYKVDGFEFTSNGPLILTLSYAH